MASDTVIQVENLGKRYELGEIVSMRRVARTLREAADRVLRGRRRKAYEGQDYVWAVRGVSFEVQRGQVLGIIGRNGAGKSTLLKILSRVTKPTEGHAELRGRVGSLLEVGTGFHPELTGRDNVYLNGAILGMTKREIDRRFDQIVDFSGIERFIDTPVKRYSSGMYTRLAFAVAAHLTTDILVCDEVLAVGDAEFQKKCLGKMRDVAHGGRTVLFVSHNMQSISTLTRSVLVLENGAAVFRGDTEAGIARYLGALRSSEAVYVNTASSRSPVIRRVEVKTSDPGNIQRNGSAMRVEVEVETPRPIASARVGFQVVNQMNVPVILATAFADERPFCDRPGRWVLTFSIPRCRLFMGGYTLTVRLAGALGHEAHEVLEGVCPFEVVMYGQERPVPWYHGSCQYTEDFNWEARGS